MTSCKALIILGRKYKVCDNDGQNSVHFVQIAATHVNLMTVKVGMWGSLGSCRLEIRSPGHINDHINDRLEKQRQGVVP